MTKVLFSDDKLEVNDSCPGYLPGARSNKRFSQHAVVAAVTI
jgi:hypothetical protein